MNTTTSSISSAMARKIANNWVDVCLSLKDLEAKKEQYENALREYVQETGELTIGPVMAYERENAPVLSGLTGKALDAAKEKLLNSFPLIGETKLSMTKLETELNTNKNVSKLLGQIGLVLSRTKKLYFKHIA